MTSRNRLSEESSTSNRWRVPERRLIESRPIPASLFLIFSAVLTLSVLPADGLDVLEVQAYKGQIYSQTTNGAPSLATNFPYVFEAAAVPLFAPYVTNVSVETPALVTDMMPMDNQTNFAFTGAADTQAALDEVYGDGTYNFNYLGQDDGQTMIPVSLGADDLPPVPQVSDVVAAQSVIFSNEFTVTFAAEAQADTNDYVQLMVLNTNADVVFQTGPIYFSEGLSATNTAIAIPGRTLAAGATYTGLLAFVRLTTLESESLPFVQAGFFTETMFPIQTLRTNGGGTQTNTSPTGPLAPTGFGGSFLTLTITNGSASLASSGTYQLFTSPLGGSYYILGPAGQSLSTGTYTYTVTGSNSATLALADAQLGSGLSLQINFAAPGTGDYAIFSGPTELQSGAFAASMNYVNITVPEFFLFTRTNGQFQSFISGQAGGSYAIDVSSDLKTWSNFTNFTLGASTLITNIGDTSPAIPRFYRARVTSVNFAPPALVGLTLNSTISGGAAPLFTNGIYIWYAATNGSAYDIIGGPGTTNGTGSYAYQVTGPNTALLTYDDTLTGRAYNEQLFFSSPSMGFFCTTNPGTTGYQSGSFNVAQTPLGFLGNVHFTPDSAHSASALFGSSISTNSQSLSVTDAAGYVWTLTVPADALTLPTAITLSPFANVDTSESALPIVSGVQLGPEGALFQDALTLTVTGPAALGPYATLLSADGSGNNLHYAATSAQGGTYSTTLLHFSSTAMSNPSGPPGAQSVAEQNHAQAVAAIVSLIDSGPGANLAPPDIILNCATSDSGYVRGQGAAYVNLTFGPDMTLIQSLLNAGQQLVQTTGSNPYEASDFVYLETVVSRVLIPEVTDLFSDYSSSPNKVWAVWYAAGYVRGLCKAYGVQVPDWKDAVVSWLQGPTMDYYFKQLTSSHDYDTATPLQFIQNQVDLLSGDTSSDAAFFQRLANAYTFQVTLTVSDMGDNFSLTVDGMVTVTGDAQTFTPISGSGTMNYESGVYGDQANDILQLPLSFPERIVIPLDTCTGSTMDIYVSQMGADNETWVSPDITQTEDYLETDFDSAFYLIHSTGNVDVDYDCEYYFTVPLQDMQAQAANMTFTGPGGFAANDVVTFTVVVQHTPQ